VLELFQRDKEKKKMSVETPKTMTTLEQLCQEDKEVYAALFPVMFLDPRKVEVSMKQAVDNARKRERDRDPAGATMWYEVAGGLAIYEGNVKKVVEYFGDAQRVAGKDYLILKTPDKAVVKAQEYYKKYLLV
jgi:hypothetical protein